MSKEGTRAARLRRHVRVRAKITGVEARPRLSVFRSLNHIYAQVIDDARGHTLAAASTADAELKDKLDGKKKVDRAGLVGSLVARRALKLGIEQIVFDCGGYKYHGRVKALAEAARQAGLKF